jgi:hypothetical protein
VIVFTVCEHEYMNMPPPQLSRLVAAQNKMHDHRLTEFKALELFYYFKFFSQSPQGLQYLWETIWSLDEQFVRNSLSSAEAL